MKRIIHHARKQSDHTKRIIVFVVIALAAVGLVSWRIYLLKVDWSDPDTRIRMSNDLAPLSEFGSDIMGNYQDTLNTEQTVVGY